MVKHTRILSSRLFPKKLGLNDPDFLGLGEIWVNTTQFLGNRHD